MNLQKPLICETEINSVTYYNMINQKKKKKPGGFPDFMGQFLICLAGFEIAGGMIMAQNDINRMMIQCFFKDKPGIGYSTGDATLAYHFKMVNPVGLVQE